ncbi:Speckle-type POZ protein B [Tetrabaena socialis]|uniref:Speckle-type POZ protein B n=1 Tax=Tetrabaena socialis TaxID=47790 RepID=A0A2J8AFM4_9CHLO|nr:Speckle-type POZ protein B [Tetrabaena socialis]|eukprot:PNH11323.1 Speckle-type POZ protein B [Tetrabaena socialis]
MSLFLEYTEAEVTPASLCPHASYSLTVENFKDQSKELTRTDIMVEKGYLSKDGSLTVRVEVSSVCSSWARQKQEQRLIPKPVELGTVGSDLLALLEEPGDTADLTITAGGRSFRVHRAVLASRCPYFKTLFASDFKEGAAKEVPLPETDPDALAFLLRYLYGGVLDSCARKLLPAAAALADRLALQDVFKTLLHRLLSTTTHETVVEDMLWAEERHDEPLLSDLEKEYLDKADSIEGEGIELLAQRSPQLLARLHKALASKFKRQRIG